MELLGSSLEAVRKPETTMPADRLLNVAMQMIVRLKCLHDAHYIHRDIKPANILYGTGENRKTLHLIDFGLARLYRDRRTKTHVKLQTGNSQYNIHGTPTYCSVNTD
jgi:serine/threonine protein kinase